MGKKGYAHCLGYGPVEWCVPDDQQLGMGVRLMGTGDRAERTGARTPKKPAGEPMRAISTPPPSSFLRLRSCRSVLPAVISPM
jgi:hypothetical protein